MNRLVNCCGITIDDVPRTMLSILLIPIMLFTLSAWTCSSAQTQTWLQIATQDLPVLSQQAQNIITLVDPADAALAQTVSTGVQAGITLVSDAITAYNQSPTATNLQKVAAAFAQAGKDLPAILTSVTFSNANTAIIITAAVDAIVATLDIIAAQIPGATPAATVARTARMNKAGTVNKSLPTPAQLKKDWNKSICGKVKNQACKLK